MQTVANDFVITVATVNGSGSQSSNLVLVRSLFRMGIPVGGRNLFPSNIAGLPTWFTIRANSLGFTSRRQKADVVVALNPATLSEDLTSVRSGGYLIHSSEIKWPTETRSDIQTLSIPFREIVEPLSDSVKMRKLLVNMVYVGVLCELLQIPMTVVDDVVAHQFGDKAEAIETNRRAIRAGSDYVKSQLTSLEFPYRAEEVPHGNEGQILIDGNSASAMGLVFGGCTFVAWYPITPSSSLVENFIDLAHEHRREADGSHNFAVVQAEDELSSISMVVGAGWAGARAMTATSGPGLSLMSEAAGLAYYAEIPAVIWDVQRVGPSTGLPTRTMQGDLLKAYYLSHGDTKHVVLLPGGPEECFEFGQTSLDLAERLQTLVIVLSDLDIGMNLHIAKRFEYKQAPFDRGKILDASKLEQVKKFDRYKDIDGDGIPYRTLPGTEHPLAAYFTRGTGHDESSRYSENNEVFQKNMQRLTRKFETAKELVPKPVVKMQPDAAVGLITFGSSGATIPEVQHLLKQKGLSTSVLRLRALPFSPEVEAFLKNHERVYVIEQNRDGQLLTILRAELPDASRGCVSITHYDGLPLTAQEVVDQILAREKV